MKKTVKETLKLAVEQLFVRIHGDLFIKIHGRSKQFADEIDFVFDGDNEAHVNLVRVCKEKIGYGSVATSQDIFHSISTVYWNSKERERLKNEKMKKNRG